MKKFMFISVISILVLTLVISSIALAYPTKRVFQMDYSSYFDEYCTGWEAVGDYHSFMQTVWPGRNNSEGEPNLAEHTFMLEQSYEPDGDSHHYRIIYVKEYFDMTSQMVYNPYAGPPGFMQSPDYVIAIDGDSEHPWTDIYGIDEGEMGYISLWGVYDDFPVDEYGHISISLEWDDGYFWWEEVEYDSGGMWHQVSGRNELFGGLIPAIDFGYEFAVVDGFWVY